MNIMRKVLYFIIVFCSLMISNGYAETTFGTNVRLADTTGETRAIAVDRNGNIYTAMEAAQCFS